MPAFLFGSFTARLGDERRVRSFNQKRTVLMANSPNHNLKTPEVERNEKLTPEARAAGRARVAQLLGELLYRQWKREQQQDEQQEKAKSK
jgi:hypothetical protein